MRFTVLSSTLLGASLCKAAAIDRPVLPHEAILFGEDGRMEIFDKTDIFSRFELATEPIFFNSSDINFNSSNTAFNNSNTIFNSSNLLHRDESGVLHKRDTRTIVMENADQKFLGWDIAMSEIVQAPKHSTVSISVIKGSMISNSVSVGGGLDIKLIKDFLGASAHIDYTKTWMTTQSVTNTFIVDKGNIGCVVSNPLTLRKSGTVFSGRIGSVGSLNHYQSDSFTSRTYKDMTWVTGLLGVCQGKHWPLHRCIGSGYLE